MLFFRLYGELRSLKGKAASTPLQVGYLKTYACSIDIFAQGLGSLQELRFFVLCCGRRKFLGSGKDQEPTRN